MTLPYSSATSGQKALDEIQNVLRNFGCSKFGSGEDFETGDVYVSFVHNETPFMVKASSKGYAAAWLRENKWNSRRKGGPAAHEAKALKQGSLAVYSILRDWIKAQVTMVEIEAMTLEGAFLSHLMLPSGHRLIEVVEKRGVENVLKLEKTP